MPGDFSRRIGIFATLLFVWALPQAAFAAVSQLKFTTEPRTVAPGEVSDTITAQLQDASGNSAAALETMDVEFSSTSATGEFLSPSTENPVTKTISTGSANKNFRYRDSVEGSFTLTLKAKGRITGAEFTATQTVVVSTESATSSATSTDNGVSGTNNTNPNSPSVHYSSAALSYFEAPPLLEISAGRSRFGTVGSPLEFSVESNLEYTGRSDFVWNFGDGSEESGEVVVHSYDYPGEYEVVLNASVQGRGSAVSRAKVIVEAPSFKISFADSERIEIENSGETEANLYGYVLWQNGASFPFPKDTIIGVNQRISFPSRITGLYPSGMDGVALLSIGPSERARIAENIERKRFEKIEELTQEISLLEKQLALLRPASTAPEVKTVPLEPEVAPSEIEVDNPSVSQTANAGSAGDASWFSTVKKFFLRR